jgi:CBS domain-containing protein
MRTEEQPIRTRSIVDGEGACTRESSVFCPQHERSTALCNCETCERLDGMHLDPTGAQSYVLCRVPARRLPPELLIRDAMTHDPVCVTPDVPLFALTALLLERGISGAPVVDERGFPVGMVSKSDLVRARFERRDEAATVGDVMMPVAFSLLETDTLQDAATLMTIEGVHRLAVVDGSGRVVGVLTALDFVRKWAGAHATPYATQR